MTIKTSTFGGWTLTGKDAEAFKKQISEAVVNTNAQASYERGKILLKEYLKNGYATIRPKDRNKS